MRAEPFSLGGMPALRWGRPSRQGILYLHGQGGSKAEAAFFAAAAADAGWQTVSVDLPGHGDRESEAAALVPWQVVPELRCALAVYAALLRAIGDAVTPLWFLAVSVVDRKSTRLNSSHP